MVPLVLLLVATMILFCMFMFRKAQLQAVVNEVARERALEYREARSSRRDLYWRFYDGQKKDYVDRIKNEIEEKYIGKEVEVTVKVERRLIGRNLIIVASDNSFEGTYFNFPLRAYSKVTIKDTSEFIRSVDFIDDIASKYEPLQQGKERYEDRLRQVKELLEKYLPAS